MQFETALAAREAAYKPSWRRLRPDLRQAVRDGAFALAYQTRRGLGREDVLGAEAQLRWPSRHHGVVQASMFMPLAAECGMTEAILAWTLNTACAAALDWPDGTVCVPVPPELVRNGIVLTLVAGALDTAGLPAARLEIALPDSQTNGGCADTLLALSALRDLGVGVALDDFGRTGACLMKLKHLPLTTVKLDRSMLRDMLADRAAASLMRATIDYAHALDMQVVASGLETEAQRHVLRAAGCDAVLERLAAPRPDGRLRVAAHLATGAAFTN